MTTKARTGKTEMVVRIGITTTSGSTGLERFIVRGGTSKVKGYLHGGFQIMYLWGI